MTTTKDNAFCIEAPGGKHRPDPDTNVIWTAFCTYCSEEIEQRKDGAWQAVPESPQVAQIKQKIEAAR